MVEAAKLLKQSNTDVCFNLVGDGRYKETLIQEIKDANVESYFNLITRQKATEIPGLLAACEVALICLEANPIFEATIPAKLQSYMACGMPILASAGGETADIVLEADCGYIAKVGDTTGFSNKIELLKTMELYQLKKIGDNAQFFSNQAFCKITLLSQLIHYIISFWGQPLATTKMEAKLSL